MAFVAVGSPPNCHDMEGGRRPGTRADFQKFLKLTQYFDCIDADARLAEKTRFAIPVDAVAGFSGQYRFLSNFSPSEIMMRQRSRSSCLSDPLGTHQHCTSHFEHQRRSPL